MKTALRWAPVILTVLIALPWFRHERFLKGQNDFAAFYAGAKLAGTGELYSRAANQTVIRSTLGFTMESVTYTRPPFYAWLLKPLAKLPYLAAYAIFSAVSVACAVWFVIRFSKDEPALPLFAAMSLPILATISDGQDTTLLLAIVGASILLARRGRDFAAGVVLSLCAIKFHLFLFVPLMLIIKGKWRILAGGTCGIAALAAIGTGSPGDYIATLLDPWINFQASVMPNLHGLIAVLHGSQQLEVILVAIVAAAFLWIAYVQDSYEFVLASAMLASLLVSFHSSIADDVLLLAIFVLIARSANQPALRGYFELILTPIPYMMSLAGAPYSAVTPVALAGLLGMLSYYARRSKPPVIALSR